MQRRILSAALALFLLPIGTFAAAGLPDETTTSVVFVGNVNASDQLIGWGSGFYVDEGIVVTNKHVIESESTDYYRVYATRADGMVDLECYQDVTKSDVKINLDDDVAYMRVYLPCAHDMLDLGDDPEAGDRIAIVGFPYRGSVQESMKISVSTGSMIGTSADGWYRTTAQLDIGNSGGPVVKDGEAVGVAVAKGVDAEGNYVEGFFIPSSVILEGLLYANDSRFGYTPRPRSSSSRSSVSSSSSVSSRASSSSSSSRSSRSSSSASRSSLPTFRDVRPARPSYESIVSLVERGVLTGYADGTFRPAAGINRAEFLKILVAGFRSDELEGETRCFSDVRSEWFASYVCAAKRLGWIDGYADGTFRPAAGINRAEALKILAEAFGDESSSRTPLPRDVPANSWFAPFVRIAIAIGIVDADKPFRPAMELTREQAAVWIDGATR